MFRLLTTDYFIRQVERFKVTHPQLKKKLAQVLRNLEQDPFEPSLKLHPLKGKLKGLYSVSLNYSYRLTLTLKISEKEMILLDIGSHDEVYR